MEKPKREPGDLAATGADDDAAPPPPAAGSPNDLGSVCAAPTSRSIAPLPSSEQHAADPESIQKTGAEADEPGTTDADDAIPSPALFAVPGGVVGLPIGSTSLSAAPASRATAPAPPSANGAAAFDAPDPDDARSLILEKFSRGRRGDLDLDLAVGSLATPRATEKPKSDPEDSAAPGADDAPPPPSTPTTPLRRLCTDSGSVRFAPTSSSATPPRPQEPHAPMAAVGSQFVDKTNGEADESAASTSRASAQPSEEPAVRGLAALGACASTPVLADDPSLLPGGITIDGKEVANSNITNGKPLPSTSMMLTRSEDGLKEGHPAAAVAKGKKVVDQQWENCKSLNGQEPVVENEEEGSLQWLEHVANQTRLLEDKAEELKQVEEEQKEKKATLQHKEDALLLERLLLREKRMKLEEEEAARARRMHNRRLPRSNSHEGFMGGSGTGTAYHDDQIVQMHLGANAQLTRSLLQHAAPLGNPATSAVTRPPTATPKAQDDTWYKRQIGYVLSLEMAAGLVFLIRPLLPDGYDRVLLAGFAAIWGLGSIGLPVGIFGTSRLEKNCSRHIGRFVSLCFSLFTIYAMYLLAVLPIDARGGNGSTSHLSPPPSASDTGDNLVVWRLVFGAIGFAVFAGHISSWVMGCRTGGDRDLELLVTED